MTRAERQRVRRRRAQRQAALTTTVLRELILIGRRADVAHVEAVGAAALRDTIELRGGVAAEGPAVAGVRVVLAGPPERVARAERSIRAAAASRMVVVEPVLPSEADRARAVERALSGRGARA